MLVYEQILKDVRVLEWEQFHAVVAPDFSFLQSSSLVYREAKMLFYDIHDFSFETVDEINKLSRSQQQRIKNVKLFFKFGLDDTSLEQWRRLSRAVAGLTAVRNLEVYWRVWWDLHEFPTMSALRAAWLQGMLALRSMTSVKKVTGRITTQMSERPESGNFVIDFEGLDGLEEAFLVSQPAKVQQVYDE